METASGLLTVLIAEDDAGIRDSLRTSINWGALGFKVCGEAHNGRVALEMAGTMRPDLMLLDICMPEMDGLEVIRTLSGTGNPPAVVVISGHSEFSFAKEAMRFGASDYLLKPFKISELSDALLKAAAAISVKREKQAYLEETQAQLKIARRVIRDKLLADILEGAVAPAKKLLSEYDITLGATKPVCALVIRHDLRESRLPNESDGGFIGKLIKQCKVCFAPYFNNEAFFCSGFVTVLLEINGDEAGIRKDFHSAMISLKGRIEAETEYTISAGIGEAADLPAQWKDSFSEARTALDARFYYGENSVFLYKDIRPLMDSAWRFPTAQRTQILRGIQSGDEKLLNAGLDGFIGELRKISIHKQAIISIAFSLLFSLYDFAKENKLELNTVFGSSLERFMVLRECETFDDMCREIALLVNDTAKLYNSRPSYNFHIKHAIEYIRENYAQDITLGDVAKSIYVSPSYLSMLFKQETGTTLNNYINKLRVETACELLKDPKVKIYEAALSAGFRDEKYFFPVFKKFMKMTPQEYRAKI